MSARISWERASSYENEGLYYEFWGADFNSKREPINIPGYESETAGFKYLHLTDRHTIYTKGRLLLRNCYDDVFEELKERRRISMYSSGYAPGVTVTGQEGNGK